MVRGHGVADMVQRATNGSTRAAAPLAAAASSIADRRERPRAVRTGRPVHAMSTGIRRRRAILDRERSGRDGTVRRPICDRKPVRTRPPGTRRRPPQRATAGSSLGRPETAADPTVLLSVHLPRTKDHDRARRPPDGGHLKRLFFSGDRRFRISEHRSAGLAPHNAPPARKDVRPKAGRIPTRPETTRRLHRDPSLGTLGRRCGILQAVGLCGLASFEGLFDA